jgi:hypothetical protein
MSNLLQTVIPAPVTFLVGYQGALTCTSRLRKSIRADMDMLDALPDGHPSRAPSRGRPYAPWSLAPTLPWRPVRRGG